MVAQRFNYARTMNCLGIAVLVAFSGACVRGNTTAPPALVLTNARIIDVASGSVSDRQTLVIVGTVIRAVGHADSIEWPATARLVDAAGKYVIPGLWDMHVHVFNQTSGRAPNTHHFPLFVSNGVTGVRELWTRRENLKQIREWRRQQAEGTLIAPRIVAVGMLVDGPAKAEMAAPSAAILGGSADIVSTPDEARRVVREVKASGFDFVKVYSNLSRDTYFAIADEARRVSIPFAGHVPFVIDAAEAAVAGQKTMEHLNQILESSSARSHELLEVPGAKWSNAHDRLMLDTFDEVRFRSLVSMLAANNTWQVPTLVREHVHRFPGDADSLLVEGRLKYIPRREVESWRKSLVASNREPSPEDVETKRRHWQRELLVVRSMRDAGVAILAGTDTGNDYIYPGFSLHDELALLVEAGLSSLEALQAATVQPARLLNLTDSFGTAKAGKRADLVLLDASPLEDIRNTQRIYAVILNGRYLDRSFLDRLLNQAEVR